jgi:hypothetical protein
VHLPVDSEQKGDLILVDLLGVESRNLTPGSSRIVTVLEIFRSKNQSREEHATTALERAIGVSILGLLHGEVVFWHVGLNQDQVVECNLESRVASS